MSIMVSDNVISLTNLCSRLQTEASNIGTLTEERQI